MSLFAFTNHLDHTTLSNLTLGVQRMSARRKISIVDLSDVKQCHRSFPKMTKFKHYFRHERLSSKYYGVLDGMLESGHRHDSHADAFGWSSAVQDVSKQ